MTKKTKKRAAESPPEYGQLDVVYQGKQKPNATATYRVQCLQPNYQMNVK